MSVGIGPRLVMVSAVAPGAGKSSVLAHLAAHVPRPMLRITEDDVWGRRELGDRPVDVRTAREDFRSIVFGEPGRDTLGMINRLFTRLVDECVSARSLWLQDWMWPDLVRMSCGGLSDWQVQHVSSDLRLRAEPLRPLILHLDVEPEVALMRAHAERGDAWFNRHFGRHLTDPVEAADIRAGAARYRADGDKRMNKLRAAGWNILTLNGAQPLGVVSAEALSVVTSMD